MSFDIAIIRFDEKKHDYVFDSRALKNNSYECLRDALNEIGIEWFDYIKVGDLNIIVDDEGLLKNAPINDPVSAMYGSPVYGNVILCRDKGAEFVSLDTDDFNILLAFFDDYMGFSQNGDENAKKYLKHFHIDEIGYMQRVVEMWFELMK